MLKYGSFGKNKAFSRQARLVNRVSKKWLSVVEKQFHFFELFPFPFLDSLSFSDFEGFEDFVFFCWERRMHKIVNSYIHEEMQKVNFYNKANLYLQLSKKKGCKHIQLLLPLMSLLSSNNRAGWSPQLRKSYLESRTKIGYPGKQFLECGT